MSEFNPYMKCVVAAPFTSECRDATRLIEGGRDEGFGSAHLLPRRLPPRTSERSTYPCKAVCHVIFESRY
jgi:hypothetical protein